MEKVRTIFGNHTKMSYFYSMIIYLTTNNINGRKYIGLDSVNNPYYYGSGTALKLALKKYGRQNFTKKILCHCETIDELNEKEQYYIKVYNAIEDPLFYNIAVGGGVVNIRPIVQYTLKGVMVRYWNSIRECENETGFNNSKLTACCQGESEEKGRTHVRRTGYGYVWRYAGDPFDKFSVHSTYKMSDDLKKKISKRQMGSNNSMAGRVGVLNSKSKKVEQYNIRGNFIKSWDSATQACKELNIVNVSSCCANDNVYHSSNYLWVYTDDENKKTRLRNKVVNMHFKAINSLKYKRKLLNQKIRRLAGENKNVSCFDLSNTFIKEYKNAVEAAKDLKLQSPNIHKCCRKEINYTGNYKFKYSKEIVQSFEKSEYTNNQNSQLIPEFVLI